MKEIIVNSAGMLPGNGVNACLNLRPGLDRTGRQVLTPVGLPREIARGVGRPLIEYIHSDDGSVSLFTASGNRLMCVRDGEVALVGVLGGRITCAAAVPEGCVTVMSEGVGASVARYDAGSDRWILDQPVDFVDPVITAETCAIISESPSVTELSSPAYEVAASVTLAAHHRVQLSKAMADAYARLDARALAAGAWLQPVVVRTRYLGHEGQTLHLSPPRLIGVPVEPVAEGELLADAKKSAVTGMALTARVFKLRLSWPTSAASMAGRVASVVVEVSPQLHPVDMQGVSECRVTRLSTSTMRLQVSMPGMRLGDSAPEAVARMVPQVLCGLDSVCVATSVVRFPSDGVPQAISLSRPHGGGVIDDIRRILAIGLRHEGFSLADAVALPHSFSARTAAVSGGTVVWGDISAIPMVAPSVLGMAAVTGERSSWTASVQVTFSSKDDDGVPHSSVSTFRHNDVTVSELSPLIVYPDPRAVSMRVAVGTQAVTVPLVPTPDGRMAYYLSPDLKNVKFDTQLSSAVVPAENPRRCHYCGGVVVASARCPLMPLSAAELPAGGVSAVTPSARSRSSWDFGRRHFYLLGSVGIHAMAVSASGGEVSLSCISPLDASAGACCITPGGVMVAAAGRMLSVSGSVVDDVGDASDVVAVAYDASHAELWMLSDDNSVTVRTPGHGDYSLSLAAESMLAASGRVYIGCHDSAIRLADGKASEVPDDGVRVRWHVRLSLPRGRIKSVEWNIAAALAELTLDLRGDGGAATDGSVRLLALDVSGQINSPLFARVVAPPRRYADLIVSGHLSCDAVVSASVLITT